MAVGSKLKIGDQQQVNDVKGFVGLINSDRPAAGRPAKKFRVDDLYMPTVGQMDQKRYERLGVPEVA
jgi:hypothetical protein